MGARGPNPYVGLRPFEVSDSHLFFGRRAQTAELLEGLYRHRFLGVVGSSGCGKSSLIKAGLITALRGGFLIEDRDQWSIARLTPGDSPLENLASALADALGGGFDATGLRQEIQSDGIESVCDRLLGSMTQENNLLVIVDQFEEIFAFRGRSLDSVEDGLDADTGRLQFQRRSEAADFVSVLLALKTRPAAPIYVVLTMRSDFLGDCDIFYGLPEAMNKGRYLVPRLTRKQLEEAIVGPAKLFGAEISKPLLDRLLNELGDRFDRLPVLQHALMRTWVVWGRKAEGPIDVAHYVEAGTLEGALGIHAKEVLDGLAATLLVAPEKRDEFERTVSGVFQSLTDTDAAGRQVRRAARLSQIAGENGLDGERVRQILKPFLDAGFLYAAIEQNSGDAADVRYALSHESLIRQWDKLKGWVSEERESRDNYLELVHFAAGEKRDERGLLRNPDLQLKRRWWERKNPRPEWAKRYRQKEEEFGEAKNYLARSRRYQLFRWVAGLVAIIAVIAVLTFATISANRLRARAEEGERNAGIGAQAAVKARDEARASEESATRSLADANKARADAVDAKDVADQRLFDSQVANLISRLDMQDPFLRDSLWTMASGSGRLRAEVIRRVLASEATALRFNNTQDLLLNALLGTNPRERVAPLLQPVIAECLDRLASLDRDRSRAEACAILIRELGAAGIGDRQLGARAMSILQERIVSAERYSSTTVLQVLAEAVSDEELRRLSQFPELNRTAFDFRLDFLVAFRNRIPEEQKVSIAGSIARNMEDLPAQLDDYTFSDVRMECLSGMLRPEDARRIVSKVLRNTPLSVSLAHMLSWLAKYLTSSEAVEVGNVLIAGAESSGQTLLNLRRLGENLPADSRAAYTDRLLRWASTWSSATDARNANLLMVFGPLYELRPLFDHKVVTAIMRQQLENVPQGYGLDRLRFGAALGGLDVLAGMPSEQLAKLLESYTWSWNSPVPAALDRELGRQLRSLLSARAAKPGSSVFLGRNQSWIFRGMEPAEWSAFLRSAPQNEAFAQSMLGAMEFLDREGAAQILEHVLEQAETPGSSGSALAYALIYAIERTTARDAFHKLPLAKLTAYFRGLVERSEENDRLVGAQGIAALNLPLSPEQRMRVSRILLAGMRDSVRKTEYAERLVAFQESLTAGDCRRVVELLYPLVSRPGTASALARMAPYLDATQVQGVLKILIPNNADAWNTDAKALAALVPSLDAGQIGTVLSALQKLAASYNSAVIPEGLGMRLAAKLAPERRRQVVQPIFARLDADLRQPSANRTGTANFLISLWEILDSAQRERCFQVMLQAIVNDTSDMFGDRPQLGIVRAAASIVGGKERLKTALLQTLERTQRGALGLEDTLLMLGQLEGKALSRQELFNILKWPTMQPWAQRELLAMLAKDASAPRGGFLRARGGFQAQYARLYNDVSEEIDWWSVSKWAAGRGLDLSPPSRPVGYQ
jgi:hypothetical protein